MPKGHPALPFLHFGFFFFSFFPGGGGNKARLKFYPEFHTFTILPVKKARETGITAGCSRTPCTNGGGGFPECRVRAGCLVCCWGEAAVSCYLLTPPHHSEGTSMLFPSRVPDSRLPASWPPPPSFFFFFHYITTSDRGPAALPRRSPR